MKRFKMNAIKLKQKDNPFFPGGSSPPASYCSTLSTGPCLATTIYGDPKYEWWFSSSHHLTPNLRWIWLTRGAWLVWDNSPAKEAPKSHQYHVNKPAMPTMLWSKGAMASVQKNWTKLWWAGVSPVPNNGAIQLNMPVMECWLLLIPNHVCHCCKWHILHPKDL